MTEVILLTEDIRFSLMMSPLLVCCTKRLSNIAIKSNDDEEISCMSMATITMGINTIEAFLLEFSHFTKPYTYTKSFRDNDNISRKYKKLMKKNLEEVFSDVYKLIQFRHDIVHHQPHSKRARSLGTVTNADGALWAAETTEKFVATMLGCPEAKVNKNWIFIKSTGEDFRIRVLSDREIRDELY